MKTIYKILILTVIACASNYGFLFSETLILKPLENDNYVSNSNKEILNSGTFYQLDYTIVYQNQNNNWVKNSKTNYIYDYRFFLIEYKRQRWQTTDWVDYESNSFLNDSSGKTLEQLRRKLNNDNWENTYKWLFDYDFNNRLSAITEQLWGKSDSTWINNFKYLYYYDEFDNNKLQLTQKYISGNFVDRSKDSNIYNSKNQLIVHYLLEWDGRYWIYKEKDVFEYDSLFNLSILTNYIMINDSTWLTQSRFKDNYDNNNNRILRIWHNWSDSIWVDAQKYEYFYKLITSIQDKKEIVNVKISPNPISDDSKIEFELSNPSYVGIKIYNELGCELFQIANAEYPAGSIIINLKEYVFQSGMYFLRIQIGKNLKIIPIVKL